VSLIENAIDALPQPYRTVFMLREIEGLTTNQTAECLDLGRGVIKTRLLRARRRLRQALQPHVTVGTFAPFRFGDFRCVRLRARVLDRIGLR
jgi:RNA polymerase sigma-70 factor (ECF subfamily)